MDVCQARKDCRLCMGATERVMELTPTPPANAFTKEAQFHIWPGYPLELRMCVTCKHVQLGHVVDPEILYRDYKYVSGTSAVFRQHFADYAKSLVDRYKLEGKRVLEIGSNDGTLLKEFLKLGCKVEGWEPAHDIAAKARNEDVFTLNEFFTYDKVSLLYGQQVNEARPTLVIANNVLAHIDDLLSTIAAVNVAIAGYTDSTLGPHTLASYRDRRSKGILVFEVQYLLDLVEKNLFDMIYHEHLDYHAVGPLIDFFRDGDMTLVDVERVPTHGGSIRCHVRMTKDAIPSESVSLALHNENAAGLFRPETYAKLAEKIGQRKVELLEIIDGLRWACLNGGGTELKFVGYGAPAKATTLLHHYGLTHVADLAYVVDDNPLKQDHFIPGTPIKVVPSAQLLLEPPDYVVVLAWNFADSIIANVRAQFQRANKPCPRFIVPLPEVRVV